MTIALWVVGILALGCIVVAVAAALAMNDLSDGVEGN